MFYLKRDGLPTRDHWLIVARNLLDPAEVKYFLSNAPAGIPLEMLLHVAFSHAFSGSFARGLRSSNSTASTISVTQIRRHL